jgi:predicted deacylase
LPKDQLKRYNAAKVGVDLNRNFPEGFTKANTGETYGGSYALSEDYSRCLNRLANTIQPLVYLDFHSGEFSLVYYQKQ